MFTINNGAVALFRIAGKDDSQQYRAITGSISTDDYTHSFVAKVPGQADQFALKSKLNTVPAGTMAPVNVTVNALDDRGNALPAQVFNFQISGPPLPPPATHVVMYEGPFPSDTTTAVDPGSASTSL